MGFRKNVKTLPDGRPTRHWNRRISKMTPLTCQDRSVRSKFLVSALLSALALFCVPSHAQTAATLWLTKPDRSAFLAKQSPSLPFTNSADKGQTIDVDSAKTYQTMDGFGFALTGGSAM